MNETEGRALPQPSTGARRPWGGQGLAGDVEQELGPGLAYAIEDCYDGAASHFARARDLLTDDDGPLRESLAAFLDSHAGYWRSQQALHDASRHFAAACADLQERLAELRRLLPPDLATGPTGRTVGAPEYRRHPASAAPHAPAARSTGAAQSELTITCFGGFSVRRAGRPVALCSNRNGQTMLRYLAAHPRHRETSDILMDALWPEEMPDRARHRLHCAASALRGALNGTTVARGEPGYLLYEDGAYALNLALPIRIDSDELVAHYEAGRRVGGAAAIADYEAACRLYVGTFLPDDLYADWCSARRERLGQLLVTMCTALAEHHAEAGQYDQAADAAQRILEENRCDETAYRLLIRVRALSGNRAEAIRQYERCKAVLAAELGVTPLPSTTALFHAVLRDEVASPRSRPA